jgi:hypothetical protein
MSPWKLQEFEVQGATRTATKIDSMQEPHQYQHQMCLSKAIGIFNVGREVGWKEGEF